MVLKNEIRKKIEVNFSLCYTFNTELLICIFNFYNHENATQNNFLLSKFLYKCINFFEIEKKCNERVLLSLAPTHVFVRQEEQKE